MVSSSKDQVNKFKKAARELETDDNENRFNERLGKIAKQKPGGALLPKKRAVKKAR
ncbi:MAG: hypothetical protein WAV72_03835 [Bradyrhizobium sp.]